MPQFDGVRISRVARKLGIADDMVARDVLQAQLLRSIFAATVNREIVLKGGMALKAAYGSHRFTKDIDLQTDGASMARVAGVIKTAMSEAVASGLIADPVISAPKQTETVQRWKLGGRVGDSAVSLTIEVSRRAPQAQVGHRRVEFRTDPDYGQAPVLVDAYDLSTIAAGKVAALTSENRVAARDLFDLDMMISMEIKPPVELLAKLGPDVLKRSLENLWDKLELLKWDEARDNLLPYLPTRVGPKVDEEVWKDMQLRTGLAVESWLKEALELSKAGGLTETPQAHQLPRGATDKAAPAFR